MHKGRMFDGHPGDTVQLLLLLLVIICAILGNGSVCCLIFRFKTLRTIPNILVLELAIVDVLNAVINASLFTAYFVLELDILRGKTLAVITEASYRCLLFLNLTTKVLLMLDRYFAISHGIRYTCWKSRSKVFVIIFIKWVFCLAVSIGSCSALWEIDLGDSQVLDYRGKYLETNGKMIKRLIILINHGLYFCLTIATFRVVRKANKVFREDAEGKNTKAALAKFNDISKVKASKTIVVLVACDFVFYLPMVLYLYMADAPGFEKRGWFPFFAHYFPFLASVNNPIIYFSRTQRFRLALLKMLRDPCGSNEMFEFRTLPGVRLAHERRVKPSNAKKTTSRKPRGRQPLDSRLEVQDSPTIKPAAFPDLSELVERNVRAERKRSSQGRRSRTQLDDFPVAFVHRTTSDDEGMVTSEPIHRQVNVILLNRRSEKKGTCCVKEDEGRGTETSNFSTEESELSPTENSHDSYDTWL